MASNPFRRFAAWLLDRISGDRDLDVEARNHPYYPGETVDGGGAE